MNIKESQKLSKKLERKLNIYIKRIEKIKWFQPEKDYKEKADKQVKLVLEAFGVKAKIEYRDLRTIKDWNVARDAVWNAASAAARDAARDAASGAGAARSAARDAARDAVWNAAWGVASDVASGVASDAASGVASDAASGVASDAASVCASDAASGVVLGAVLGAVWNAAWGATDLLVMDLKEYKKKYPKGNFINIIPLWEMGLYPVGVIKGKFIIYVPKKNNK